MSVVIDHLTKQYGQQLAVNDISFEVPVGSVTGFLGPNGAGKSTTMKMVVGYVRPTLGRILLDGMDVAENALKVRQFTGYLPEHNPLYLEMYVREFLRFIASAYHLKNAKSRIEEIIEQVGLERERSKKIGSLSKGYRQRVGLAKALIHNPKVLILDEPTTGLDPNQILEIRQLIKSISVDKTVILSTHIMQEVEAICDQVVIIDRGKLVANDKLAALKAGLNAAPGLLVSFEQEVDISVFEQSGLECEKVKVLTWLIRSERPDLRAEVLRITSEHQLPLVSVTKPEQSLESVFHQLTEARTER